jgi:signal transduction histidine kinase
MQEGRAALHSLRTSTTEGNDLFEAFKRAVESDVVPSSMVATCSVVGEPREMHPIVRDEVYRIGYEAILNACLHSKARRLGVALEYGRDLTLRVADDGVGIDGGVVSDGKPGHFGLQGMHERAARIEGKLTLITSENSGTAFTLVVPGGIAFQKAQLTPLSRVRGFLKRTGGGEMV